MLHLKRNAELKCTWSVQASSLLGLSLTAQLSSHEALTLGVPPHSQSLTHQAPSLLTVISPLRLSLLFCGAHLHFGLPPHSQALTSRAPSLLTDLTYWALSYPVGIFPQGSLPTTGSLPCGVSPHSGPLPLSLPSPPPPMQAEVALPRRVENFKTIARNAEHNRRQEGGRKGDEGKCPNRMACGGLRTRERSFARRRRKIATIDVAQRACSRRTSTVQTQTQKTNTNAEERRMLCMPARPARVADARFARPGRRQ